MGVFSDVASQLFYLLKTSDSHKAPQQKPSKFQSALEQQCAPDCVGAQGAHGIVRLSALEHSGALRSAISHAHGDSRVLWSYRSGRSHPLRSGGSRSLGGFC